MTKLKNAYFEIADSKLKLANIPTGIKNLYQDDKDYETALEDGRKRLEEFQNVLYASHKQSVLIIFQGMDSSGKDGAIKHVMAGINPQGCSVTSFKAPSREELNHDFLWRSNLNLPANGEIKIFNRSYYEEVLITKVHPELLKDEHLPNKKINHKFWQKRYRDIVQHEAYLQRQGFEIIKIFLHISKSEQKTRLLERFNDPKKQWKIERGDIEERRFWKEYQRAYEECINETSTTENPWLIVPGDDKKNARLAISDILIKRFERMKLQYPKLTTSELKRLKKMRAILKAL